MPSIIQISTVKDTFDYLTPIAIAVIAFLQCLIFIRQTDILQKQVNREIYADTEKRKLDLFEKRFLVFDAIREILKQVLSEDKLPMKDLYQFRFKVADAEFLFNSDINDFIRQLEKELASFHIVSQRINRNVDFDGNLSDESIELSTLFISKIESLHDLFTPYMKLN